MNNSNSKIRHASWPLLGMRFALSFEGEAQFSPGIKIIQNGKYKKNKKKTISQI